MEHAHDAQMYQETGFVLFIMIATCVLITYLGARFKQKIPLAVTLFVSMIVGAVAGGFGFPFRHLMEGPMFYLFINMVIFASLIMLQVMKESGNMDDIAWDIMTHFRTKPVILFFLLTAMLFFPGMVTGVGAAAVLSTGVIVAVILQMVGIPKVQTAVILGVVTTLGAAAPPVNLPALIISSGINMPYDGFTTILWVLTLPPALFTIFYCGWRHFKVVSLEDIHKNMIAPVRKHFILSYLPLLTICGLFLLIRIFPGKFPDLVSPLVFIIGAIVGLFTGKKVNIFKAASTCMQGRLFFVVAIFFVVGSVVQIMTLTGVKGLIVITVLTIATLAPIAMYLILTFAVPLFGGVVTHLGAAAVLGVPLALALLTKNSIVVVACISIFCIISQVIPPSALGGYSSMEVTGLSNYRAILKKSLLPLALTSLYTIVILIYADQFASWFV